MDNYEYIISSLPFLTRDFVYGKDEDFGQFTREISRELQGRDAAAFELLLRGFDSNSLGKDFYTEALASGSEFIREYFTFDLHLRNAKVEYLNAALDRPAGTDTISLEAELPEFGEESAVQAALSVQDLLGREKALDDICWDKIESISLFHYFDLTAVLAYVAKLHIADRWLSLDEEKGRELFRKLVDEVRGSFKGNYQSYE